MNIKKSLSNLRVNTLNDNEEERRKQKSNIFEKYKKDNLENERLNTDTIIDQKKIMRENNSSRKNIFSGRNSQQAKKLSKKLSHNNFNMEKKILKNPQKEKLRIDSLNKIVGEVDENNKHFNDERNKIFANVITSRRNPSINNKNQLQKQQNNILNPSLGASMKFQTISNTIKQQNLIKRKSNSKGKINLIDSARKIKKEDFISENIINNNKIKKDSVYNIKQKSIGKLKSKLNSMTINNNINNNSNNKIQINKNIDTQRKIKDLIAFNNLDKKFEFPNFFENNTKIKRSTSKNTIDKLEKTVPIDINKILKNKNVKLSNVDINKLSKRNISSANINRYNSIVSASNYINSDPNQQICFQKGTKELLAKNRYNQFSVEYPSCKTELDNVYTFSEGNQQPETEKDFIDFNNEEDLDNDQNEKENYAIDEDDNEKNENEENFDDNISEKSTIVHNIKSEFNLDFEKYVGNKNEKKSNYIHNKNIDNEKDELNDNDNDNQHNNEINTNNKKIDRNILNYDKEINNKNNSKSNINEPQKPQSSKPLIPQNPNEAISVSSLISNRNIPITIDNINLEFPGYEQTKYSNKPSNKIKAYAANTYQGLIRNYNEDRVSIILNIAKPPNFEKGRWPKCSFFGIYDGHGGYKCADFLRDKLHTYVIRDESFPMDPKTALENGFKKAEKDFIYKIAIDKDNLLLDKSGSCAVVALIVDDICYISNVGDSRIIMSKNSGKDLVVLTNDHKPNEEGENKRINENGGKVYQTFGDVEAKLSEFGGLPNVVIAEPEITSFSINEEIDFILLGCDGIYDQLSNEDCLNSIWMSIKGNIKDPNLNIHCAHAVDMIMKSSLMRRTLDNITTLLIGFENLEDFVKEKNLKFMEKISPQSNYYLSTNIVETKSDNNNYEELYCQTEPSLPSTANKKISSNIKALFDDKSKQPMQPTQRMYNLHKEENNIRNSSNNNRNYNNKVNNNPTKVFSSKLNVTQSQYTHRINSEKTTPTNLNSNYQSLFRGNNSSNKSNKNNNSQNINNLVYSNPKINNNHSNENSNKLIEKSENRIPLKIVKNKYGLNNNNNENYIDNNDNKKEGLLSNFNSNPDKDPFSFKREDNIGNRKLYQRKLLNGKNNSLHNFGNLINDKNDNNKKLETEGNLKMPILSGNIPKENYNYPVLNTENNDTYSRRKNNSNQKIEENSVSPQFKRIEDFKRGIKTKSNNVINLNTNYNKGNMPTLRK